MTATYQGQADVARWCGGVSTAAVSNWLARHPDTAPAPDVVIVTEGARHPVRGWLPERRAEWEAFAASRNARPGAAAAGAATRKNRRAAEMIYADMQAGNIDAETAARLLHELI